jgi:hypothetical protein
VTGGFHPHGESSVRGHAPEPPCQSREIAHGGHREDIPLDPGLQQHLGEGQMTVPHRLAYPTPGGSHAHADERPHTLDVASS